MRASSPARLTRIADEDTGTADPNAVRQAPAAWDVDARPGSPEGRSAIAQAIVYRATVSVTGPSSET
nr:hypothetical protein [Glycomyces albidus]